MNYYNLYIVAFEETNIINWYRRAGVSHARFLRALCNPYIRYFDIILCCDLKKKFSTYIRIYQLFKEKVALCGICLT